jgi:hypothetical protein
VLLYCEAGYVTLVLLSSVATQDIWHTTDSMSHASDKVSETRKLLYIPDCHLWPCNIAVSETVLHAFHVLYMGEDCPHELLRLHLLNGRVNRRCRRMSIIPYPARWDVSKVA